VTHDGDLYRVSYSARDGGVLLGEFARTLVGMEWSGDITTDLVPPLPRPAGVFFAPVWEASEAAGGADGATKQAGPGR
jgi:hypothetical protein